MKMGAKSAVKTTKWGQKAPAQIRDEKVWGQKVPSKCKSGGQKAPSKQQSDGKKRHHSNQSEKVMVAECAIKMEKWWRKMPPKQQSDGKKCHHISYCGGTLTTTYHIQGAGAPAKTENYVNADAFIFFREKVRPFPHLAKPISRTFGKDEKSNGTDKKRLV